MYPEGTDRLSVIIFSNHEMNTWTVNIAFANGFGHPLDGKVLVAGKLTCLDVVRECWVVACVDESNSK